MNLAVKLKGGGGRGGEGGGLRAKFLNSSLLMVGSIIMTFIVSVKPN